MHKQKKPNRREEAHRSSFKYILTAMLLMSPSLLCTRALIGRIRNVKKGNKESYKKLVVSSRPIPDIEQLLQEEYEDEDVNVKIVELSTDTLQKKDIVIGENRPKEIVEKKQNKTKVKNNMDIIPGMDTQEEDDEAGEDDNNDGDDQLKSKKEVKKILKRQATKKLQKSKVFQMKSKLDRIQNKKSQKKKAKTEQRKEKSKKKNHRKKH
ncbi:unnamed protein product [Danaus chrysippus]|uniref:(African queen) hypothetical protein n=1 Tax=Danaus chrysippus TaxID=151541 RepID=A0A8J2WDB2_9NEOP|nr:unnamed protein product [Danaus chrysippus]